MGGLWGGGLWCVFDALHSGLLTEPVFFKLRKMRSQTTYAPYLRPAPPYIIDVGWTRSVKMYYNSAHRMNGFLLLAFTTESVPGQLLNVIMH